MKVFIAASGILVSVMALFYSGCATTSQIEALERKVDEAMERADKALAAAKSAQVAVDISAKHNAQVAVNANHAEFAAARSEAASVRAEDAASRAAAAEKSAQKFADAAKEEAAGCRDIIRRFTAK